MFLADENVPPKVIEFLRSTGYKVKDVREGNLQGISDNELIQNKKIMQRTKMKNLISGVVI